MANYTQERSSRQSDDTMDDDLDDKDDTKRKSRNLSEKKRRDQFNLLVNELGSMVSSNTRRMDKSTVLKATILFLKNHNEITDRSRVHEIQEDWKPSFLSNEEFTHLILEALDGFIIVFSSDGRIHYISESVTSLLGYLPNELENNTIYEIAYQGDQTQLYNLLLNPFDTKEKRNNKEGDQISFTCHIRRSDLNSQEDPIYELVHFIGYFRSDVNSKVDNLISNAKNINACGADVVGSVFVGTGRLQIPQLIREVCVIDSTKSEFSSRHSLEWKFLFLDHRAPPIIGYLPFEVLGTSGYDYYHVDDLDKVIMCHESLMRKGEGTSCHYRFLTKGQQWIWLQTIFYITYNQWNSKPEFIVCTHRVISYVDVIKEMRSNVEHPENVHPQNQGVTLTPLKELQSTTEPCQWSTKTSKLSKPMHSRSGVQHHSEGSNSSSILSVQNSLHSHNITQDTKSPSLNNMVISKSLPPMDATHALEVDESCLTFIEPNQYTTINIQPIVAADFTHASSTSLIPTSSTPEILHHQGIIMTPAQNQIQDELQRKQEELQQLIVHQQEELRKISEQLFIAKYGILSPLINNGMPYNQTSRVVEVPTSIQGMNVLSAPIAEPVTLVSPELFSHQLPDDSVTSSSLRGNVAAMIQSEQRIQSHNESQGSHRENDGVQLVPFQMCPQPTEIIYTNMPAQVHQQPSRLSQN